MNKFPTLRITFVLFGVFYLHGCGGGSGGGSGGAGPAAAVVVTPAPTMSSTLHNAVVVIEQLFEFDPLANAGDLSAPVFSVENLPAWMNFDAASGKLSGLPLEEHLGAYLDIRLSRTDSVGNVVIDVFDINVVTVTENDIELAWVAPTQREDGTLLTDLSGFRVLVGRNEQELEEFVDLPDPAIDSFMIENLSSGVWWFALIAYDSSLVESNESEAISVSFN